MGVKEWWNEHVEEPIHDFYDAVVPEEVKEVYDTIVNYGGDFLEYAEQELIDIPLDVVINKFTDLATCDNWEDAWSIIWDTKYYDDAKTRAVSEEGHYDEVHVEEYILNNPDNAAEIIDSLLHLEIPESEKMNEDIVRAAEDSLQEIRECKDADLSEALVSGLLNIAKAGSTAVQPLLQQVLGPYAYDKLKEADWDLTKLDAPGLMSELVLSMVTARYSNKSEENEGLTALLSILRYAIGKDDEWAMIMRGCQMGSCLVQGALPGIAQALSDMLGIPLGASWTTELINGSAYFVLGLGPYKLAVSSIPVNGFDVRVIRVKSGADKAIHDATRILPKAVRAKVSSYIEWAFNPDIQKQTEELIRGQVSWQNALPNIRELLEQFINRDTTPDANDDSKPDEDQPSVVDPEKTLPLDSNSADSRKKKVVPDDETDFSSTDAYQRAHARRARLADAAKRDQRGN